MTDKEHYEKYCALSELKWQALQYACWIKWFDADNFTDYDQKIDALKRFIDSEGKDQEIEKYIQFPDGMWDC